MSIVFKAALPILAATLLVACGGSDDTASTPDAPATTAPNATTAPPATAAPEQQAPAGGDAAATVPAALQFTAPLVGGGEIEMGTLAGRPVLLWFWAPW